MAISAADLLVNVRADVDDARRKIKQVDDDLDKLGGTFDVVGKAAKVFGIAAAVGFASIATSGATSAVLAFGASLAPMAGLLAALPAVVAAGGAAFATLALGLHGTSDAFKALMEGDPEKFAEALKKLAPNAQEFFKALQAAGPAFSHLRLHVQNELFAGLGFHVNRLARIYLPALEPGMRAIARGFNQAARAVADFLSRADVVMDVKSIFDNTGKATESLKNVFPDLTAAFLDFATVGASLMPEFLTYLEGGAERFRAWADEARRSGKIEEWIRNGATAARDFGGILVNLAQIVGIVGDAARQAFGGTLLGNLKEATQRVEDFLRSAEGQTALNDFFTALRASMTAIGPAIKELFLAFTQGLIPALSNLAVGVAPGLAIALAAIKEALIILQPAFLTVGQAVGTLLTHLAPLIPVIAQFIADLVERLAPHLPAIIGGIVGLALAFKALSAISAATQALSLFLSPVGLAVLALAALVAGLVYAYRESETFRNVVNDVWKKVQAGAAALMDFFTGTLWPAIQRVWRQITDKFGESEGRVKTTMDRFRGTLESIKEYFRTWMEALTVGFQTGVTVITALWETFGDTILTFLRDTVDALLTVADGLFTMLTGFLDVFIGVFTGDWRRAWDGVKKIFEGAATILVGVFDLLMSRIKAALSLAWDAITGLFRLGWEVVKKIFTTAAANVITFVAGIPARVFGALAPLAAKLTAAATSAWQSFQIATQARVIALMTYVKTIPGLIKAKFANMGNLLKSAGEAIMNGLKNGIERAGRAAVEKARELANAVKDAAKNVLGISSPSKVMDQIGRWTGEGLADGIAAMERTVARAGADMAAAAVPDVRAGAGLAPTVPGGTGSSSGSVTVAPGALQVIVQGNVTGDAVPQLVDGVDAAFRRLLAEIQSGRIPGRVV